MADLIDRDLTVYELECFKESCIGACMYMGFDDIINVVKSIPTVNRWIPCSERLPENYHPVLITWVNNSPVMSCYEKDKGKPFTGCAHYCNGKWYWYSQFSDDILAEYGEYQETVDVDVLAWMPIPDAYNRKDKR